MSVFSDTYPQARQKFLDAARDCGAAVTSYPHTEAKGPSGEALFMDVARMGAADARHVLVVGCGTHGIEGYSGSAAQTNWMKTFDMASIPAGAAVLFIHAHNPWGFAHALRFTEENVDLNRNFVDWSATPPANPGYAQVHQLIARPEWREDEVEGLFAQLAAFKDQVGEQAYSDAFNGGQYSHPEGIFYGGAREQWSNRTFRTIVREHLAGATSAAMVDLHTGIGPHDGHIFLCFHPPGSPGYERARRWWGERAVNREGVTHKAVAKYQGLLVDAFCDMLAGQQTTAVVVEFGTLPRPAMQRASMAARWLWATPDADPALRVSLMHDIREAFYPSAPAWRAGVLAQSREIIDRGLAGIAHSA
ncbi:M14 family metallopeptidase [Xylophilus sp. GOD-11R]|uniref:M14 family metallopeptidase n=1 Tax=Xylophilus sp. GOD-11R TaxID=3089814 RepID=UPI00298C5FFA|nr:M14 family metallopeptidase [Xylophilus sp. GOD-11R]WPB56298.1 M14 family metallopeptidase [Xylophilus sp. GOD-11R]